MNSNVKKSSWLIPFICCTHALCAQFYTHRYEAGLSTGTFIYQGDLTPATTGSYRTLLPNIGFSLARIMNHSFSIQANFTSGKISGNDALYEKPEYRRERNFKFSSPINEFSGVLVWNMLAKNGIEQPRGFSPYVFAGAGITLLHINRDWSNYNAAYFNSESVSAGLTADIAHTPPQSLVVLPMGVGVKYALTRNLSLAAETNYRFMMTDYLDGFSQSANPDKKDGYYGHSVKLILSLGYKDRTDCPW